MSAAPREPLPNAVVATRHAAVRDFLIVHLQDRGFAVASAEETGFITWFAQGAVALVADFELWDGLELPGDPALLLLTASPSTDQARRAAEAGAVDYLAIPFANTRRLATTLDTLAARAGVRRAAMAPGRTAEPALVG